MSSNNSTTCIPRKPRFGYSELEASRSQRHTCGVHCCVIRFRRAKGKGVLRFIEINWNTIGKKLSLSSQIEITQALRWHIHHIAKIEEIGIGEFNITKKLPFQGHHGNVVRKAQLRRANLFFAINVILPRQVANFNWSREFGRTREFNAFLGIKFLVAWAPKSCSPYVIPFLGYIILVYISLNGTYL